MSEQFAAIRQALEAKRAELEERLAGIARDTRHEDREIEQDSQERAIELENEEVLTALGESGRQELDAVIGALARLDNGEYGVCVQCGEKIAPTRLEALPFADACIKCAE